MGRRPGGLAIFLTHLAESYKPTSTVGLTWIMVKDKIRPASEIDINCLEQLEERFRDEDYNTSMG